MTSELALFDDDPGRVPAIADHPAADLEYGAGAAVARSARKGHEAVHLLATNGEPGIDALPAEECGAPRVEEQHRSAAVIGVDAVEFLDHADGALNSADHQTVRDAVVDAAVGVEPFEF